MDTPSHTIRHHFDVGEIGEPLVELIYQEKFDFVEIGNSADGFVVVELARLLAAVRVVESLAYRGNS